ncbi:hypothetical protein [Flavobacterium sp. SM2513]|uniref:hypothetical protein n=1 Tax=Flavobacterium sp. SM2513 TaxID=3424766 RepID=UPI003D7F3559
MSQIILIHPDDATTKFLTPITDILREVLGDKLILLEPSQDSAPSNEELSKIIDEYENVETVIFMGHGSRSSLHGGTSNENEQHELFNFKNASRFLTNKNFICLSCWSVHFVYGLEGIKSSISFGNLPTTWKDITEARSISKNAYQNYTEKSIEIYQYELVNAFALGLKNGLGSSVSLKNIYNFIKLLINKAISKLVKEKSNLDQLLAARQLYILKLQMNLIEI